MSEEVVAVAFAGYFRRWQEIEDAKQRLSDESKDLFGDMKASGYDSKATRAVFRDKRKGLNADPAETQEQEAIYDLYMDALNRGLSKAPARPAPAHVENTEQFGAEPVQELHEVPAHDAVVEYPRPSAPAPLQSDPAGAAESPPVVPAPIADAEVPAFLKAKKTVADYRPHCQKPDACGASGLQHCYSCKKAMGESEAA